MPVCVCVCAYVCVCVCGGRGGGGGARCPAFMAFWEGRGQVIAAVVSACGGGKHNTGQQHLGGGTTSCGGVEAQYGAAAPGGQNYIMCVGGEHNTEQQHQPTGGGSWQDRWQGGITYVGEVACLYVCGEGQGGITWVRWQLSACLYVEQGSQVAVSMCVGECVRAMCMWVCGGG